MRRLSALLALTLAPCLALAQGTETRLVWDVELEGSAEAVLTVRDVAGAQILVIRNAVERDARGTSVPMPPLPRTANSMQAGLVDDGRVVAQSVIRQIGNHNAPEEEMHMQARLALAFQDLWACDDGQIAYVRHGPTGRSLRLAEAGSKAAHARISATPPVEADVVMQRDDNEARITAPDGTVLTCRPSLFRPLLPFDAVAFDGSWQLAVGLNMAILSLPDSEETHIDTADIAFHAARDGIVTLATDDLNLVIETDDCALASRQVPFSLTAQLRLNEDNMLVAGCAGSPLHLIDGASWVVDSVFGYALEGTDGNPPPAMNIKITGAEVSGRGACNRYLGVAQIVSEELRFTDIGTTRLGCPLHKLNLEQRFLDALEVTTGFALSRNGMLILRAGHMPVLTARRASVSIETITP